MFSTRQPFIVGNDRLRYVRIKMFEMVACVGLRAVYTSGSDNSAIKFLSNCCLKIIVKFFGGTKDMHLCQ